MMKARTLFLALCFLGLGYGIQAQGVIKVNPLALAFGTINVGYEKITGDNSSIYVGASIISRKIVGIRYTGFGVEGQYRKYLTKAYEAPKGLYVAPQVGVSFVSFDDGFSNDNFNYTLITLGALIGYQWTFAEDFTVELGLGPAYGILAGDDFGDTNVFGDGIVPIGILSLGYIIGN